MSRDMVIDENSAWDWNISDATNKPLMSYEVDEESSEHGKIPVDNVPVIVEVGAKNWEGLASTRPQSTRVLPARLQDYEVGGDDEFKTNGELVHFSLVVDAD